jgi:lipid-A-disaccharide synthase
MHKKIFIISGEASGDLHASNLVKELLKLNNNIDVTGWGGPLMEAQGVTILKNYKELAFMGFSEVLLNINTIRKNFILCKQQISQFKPDLIVFVDYPGFNLRMAKWAKQQGYNTCYYISPQIWAWKENRIHGIKKYIDKMLVILPFEKQFYAKHNMEVAYVGHPLATVVSDFNMAHSTTKPHRPIIALLPGSREQEIIKKLPIMLSVSKHFPEYDFVVAIAPGMTASFYQTFLSNYTNVGTVNDSTYSLLQKSTAALVTSGTATLETALFKVPQVVCYIGNPISYYIAKKLITIKYISLVNLIMDQPIVPELIQNQCNESNLVASLTQVLQSENYNSTINHYNELFALLTKEGNASAKAASLVVEMLEC